MEFESAGSIAELAPSAAEPPQGDHSYELAVASVASVASIVEIPIHWALDDCFVLGVSGEGLIESPARAQEMWSLELDAA